MVTVLKGSMVIVLFVTRVSGQRGTVFGNQYLSTFECSPSSNDSKFFEDIESSEM